MSLLLWLCLLLTSLSFSSAYLPRALYMTTTTALPCGPKEVVGVIIVDHGSRREEANKGLLELVRRYRSLQTAFTIVEPAHMELASPSIEDAFRSCVEQGASTIICHPYFLSQGRHVSQDIPALMASAADKFPGVKYCITEPLGGQERITELIHSSIMSSRPSQDE